MTEYHPFQLPSSSIPAAQVIELAGFPPLAHMWEIVQMIPEVQYLSLLHN